MSAEVQHELEEAVARLAELHPTKIAVESPFGDAQLSEAYHQYIQGEHRLQPNEREQLGFRLARRLGHPTVYSIDSRQEWNFTDDLKKLREYGQSASADELSAEFARIGTVVNSVVQEKTVREILRFLNGADLQARIHGLYLLLARMGRNEEYPGVESISKWYSRNLRIYVNLTRIIDSPDDRVLVIYGMGHVKLLQQFVSESPDLELVSIEPYL